MVEAAVSHPAGARRRLPDIGVSAVSAWALGGAIVLYLALDGGGYALATHSQIGIAVWWIVIVCSAWGLLPAAPVSRVAITALAFLTAFVAWTALATTWSISSGRSLQDLSLVACYLGIFALAATIHRERGAALRHTAGALATVIVIVAALSVASRIWPAAFPAAQQTGQFLSGVRARLSWPLNYWNALAAFMAMGVPLLLGLATSARTLRVQAFAAGAIPLVALCTALTLSRGGVIAAGVVLVVFFLLAPERLSKLATAAPAALGSALLIAAAFNRHAFQQDLLNAAAHHEAATLLVPIVLACAGVGVMQVGIGLAARHGTLPGPLRVPVPRARALFAGALVVLVVAGIAAGVPGKLSHEWQLFKNPHQTASQNSDQPVRHGKRRGPLPVLGRGGSLHGRPCPRGERTGHVSTPLAPPGTVSELRHERALPVRRDAGRGGDRGPRPPLRLLRRRPRRRHRRRRAHAVRGPHACGGDRRGDGRVPRLRRFRLDLAGGGAPGRVHAARRRTLRAVPRSPVARDGSRSRITTIALRGTLIAAGVASLAAIVFPMATSTALSQSQAAASAGNTQAALADAQQAVAIEPGSAAAHLQVALVLELDRAYPAAVTEAHLAVRDEPANWSNWLVLSRVEAEAGHARASVTAYDEARALNPQSPLFRS